MIKWYKDKIVDDIHETNFHFCVYKNQGMNVEQIDYIRQLIGTYLLEYPMVGIETVCDYFSWDYDEKFSVYNYLHNDRGELYADREEIAQYCDEDKLIGFNHVRLSGVELENDAIINKLEKVVDKLNNVISQHKKIGKKAEILGLQVPDFGALTSRDKEFLCKHEIYAEQMSWDYYDVVFIRMLEEALFIKRIVLHEFGHAISRSYCVDEDIEIQKLYDKYKNSFEDIEEFIAECFMASELTDKISLANLVKKRIMICKKVLEFS